MKTALKFRNIHGKTLASEFFNIEDIHLAYLLTETPAQLFWHKILQNFLEQFFNPGRLLIKFGCCKLNLQTMLRIKRINCFGNFRKKL